MSVLITIIAGIYSLSALFANNYYKSDDYNFDEYSKNDIVRFS